MNRDYMANMLFNINDVVETIQGHSITDDIIEEKFVGYADITIEAETEEEAIALYNRGHYPDSQYDIDDMFYDHQFNSIREEK